MSVVLRLSADEVRLIRAGLHPIMVAKRWYQADEHHLIWQRLEEIDRTMGSIVDAKTGLIRLDARDTVALQFATRVGREMLKYHPKRRIMDGQAERAAALMAKLEKYRKRIHRRDGITTPSWRHSAYAGWIQFRMFIRGTHSFGRRTSIPGITMPRHLVSRALLREMRQLVAEYGPDIFERFERGELSVVPDQPGAIAG